MIRFSKSCQNWKYRQRKSNPNWTLLLSSSHVNSTKIFFFSFTSSSAMWCPLLSPFSPTTSMLFLFFYTCAHLYKATLDFFFWKPILFLHFQPAVHASYSSPSSSFAFKIQEKKLPNNSSTHNKLISTQLAFGFPQIKVRIPLKFLSLIL